MPGQQILNTVNLLFNGKMGEKQQTKAYRTRELSAELTVTREHWRKQVPPVCGKILKDFWHA